MLRKAFVLSIAVILVAALVSTADAEMWKPKKPITIIVPWSAGGSTDQVTRIVAGELEEP
ncbi:MAG: tripartite tricarboxylate transporter substrate binding protein, partial [Proteobacteria bacterium]|nr:tripartite tricarboxylate transporter substrate binding protein [Pseudomonadota bacterium]